MIIALTKLIICSTVLTVCNPKQVVYFTNHEFFTLDYREFEICQIVSKCLRLVDKEYSNQWPTQSLIFAVFRLVYFLLSSLKRIRSTPPLYLMSTPTRWELYTVCMTWNKHESWQYYDFVSCFLPFSEGCLFEECSIGWHVYVFILQPNNKIFVKQVFFASKRKKLYLSRGVLMLASPVFRKMLTSKGEGTQIEISLPEESQVMMTSSFSWCFSPMEYVELLYGIFWENTIWVMSFYWFFKSVKGVKYWFYFFKLNSNNSCFRSSFPTGLQFFKKLDYLHSSWNLWIVFK